MKKLNRHDLMLALSFDELIQTLHANEQVINEESVRKVFRRILENQVEQAYHELDFQMQNIIKEAKGN